MIVNLSTPKHKFQLEILKREHELLFRLHSLWADTYGWHDYLTKGKYGTYQVLGNEWPTFMEDMKQLNPNGLEKGTAPAQLSLHALNKFDEVFYWQGRSFFSTDDDDRQYQAAGSYWDAVLVGAYEIFDLKLTATTS